MCLLVKVILLLQEQFGLFHRSYFSVHFGDLRFVFRCLALVLASSDVCIDTAVYVTARTCAYDDNCPLPAPIAAFTVVLAASAHGKPLQSTLSAYFVFPQRMAHQQAPTRHFPPLTYPFVHATTQVTKPHAHRPPSTRRLPPSFHASPSSECIR